MIDTELGERIRNARLKAGLSQKALCGNVITRNMLSMIENGSASPSVATLQYIAKALNVSAGSLLEDNSISNSDAECIQNAWNLLENQEYEAVLTHLESFHGERVFTNDVHLLRYSAMISLAEQCIPLSHTIRAKQLLQEAEGEEQFLPFLTAEKYRRILLQNRIGEPIRISELPPMDEFLLIRAEKFVKDNPASAINQLNAMTDQSSVKWQLLRGKAAMGAGDYQGAVRFLKAAESDEPYQAVPLLERCFERMQDYQSAYQYACKARELNNKRHSP